MADRLEIPSEHGELDPSWWAPLLAVCEIAAVLRPQLDVADFMVMARIRRRSQPRLTLYKHVVTRRYLNLDDAGHAYRYTEVHRSGKITSRYLAHRDLLTAVDHLDLSILGEASPRP